VNGFADERPDQTICPPDRMTKVSAVVTDPLFYPSINIAFTNLPGTAVGQTIGVSAHWRVSGNMLGKPYLPTVTAVELNAWER
jgi:hypothetical protein